MSATSPLQFWIFTEAYTKRKTPVPLSGSYILLPCSYWKSWRLAAGPALLVSSTNVDLRPKGFKDPPFNAPRSPPSCLVAVLALTITWHHNPLSIAGQFAQLSHHTRPGVPATSLSQKIEPCILLKCFTGVNFCLAYNCLLPISWL